MPFVKLDMVYRSVPLWCNISHIVSVCPGPTDGTSYVTLSCNEIPVEVVGNVDITMKKIWAEL